MQANRYCVCALKYWEENGTVKHDLNEMIEEYLAHEALYWQDYLERNELQDLLARKRKQLEKAAGETLTAFAKLLQETGQHCCQ